MKFVFFNNQKPVVIKSKVDFFAYYFQNMLDLVSGVYSDKKAERRDILKLANQYKKCFWLYDYSSVRIWVNMKDYFHKNFDNLLFFCMEYENGRLSFPISYNFK